MTGSILDLQLIYEPRLTRIELQGGILFSRVPTGGRVFLREAMDAYGSGFLTVGRMYGRRWAEDSQLLQMFRGLGEEDKLGVLKFVTSEIHELTHHVDYLRTPFGAAFHSRSIREHLALRRLAPLLLAHPEFLDVRPMWELDGRLESNGGARDPQFSEAWHEVRGPAGTSQALGDGGSATPRSGLIVDGWNGNTKPLKVLGQKFQKVTVADFFQTFAIPTPTSSGVPWYVRPLAIFECRAVANSLLWISDLLGPDASADLALYFDRFYAAPGQRPLPDYVFLANLFARAFGYTDFRALLASGDHDLVDDVLRRMVAACWYALHAPPLMDENSLPFSNPVARLIVFLRPDNFTHRPFPFSSIFAYMHTVDEAEYAIQLYFGSGPRYSLTDVFERCRKTVDYLAGVVTEARLNPEVQRHFFRIIRIIYGQFCRYPTYADRIGMDPVGNPVLGASIQQDGTLLDPYEPDPSVIAMFAFRKQLLFSMLGNREQLLEGLRAHFMDPNGSA